MRCARSRVAWCQESMKCGFNPTKQATTIGNAPARRTRNWMRSRRSSGTLVANKHAIGINTVGKAVTLNANAVAAHSSDPSAQRSRVVVKYTAPKAIAQAQHVANIPSVTA